MNESRTLPALKPLYRLYFKVLPQPKIVSLRGLVVTQKPLWRDISSWQKNWNAIVSRANGVCGVFIRASAGLSADTYFSVNYALACISGMFRTSYHAIYPNLDLTKQLDLWYKLHPEIEGIPRMLDVEVQNGVEPLRIGQIVFDACEKIYSRDGVRPILYSRANLIDLWFQSWSTEDLNIYYYNLAQYQKTGAEHPGPVTLPKRVNRNQILWHQTSDHKIDFPGEVDSMSVDWDRWELGDHTQMYLWIKQNWLIDKPYPCGDWYQDLDTWARSKGFVSAHQPPSGGPNG